MFYHQNRITKIAHFKKCFTKLLIVSLVQTDTRFIENIEDAGQL